MSSSVNALLAQSIPQLHAQEQLLQEPRFTQQQRCYYWASLKLYAWITFLHQSEAACTNTTNMATGTSSARHCCVPQCTSDSRYDATLSFHQVPKDKLMKKQWIIKIRRDEGPKFKITCNTVVCSKHFKKDYFKWTPVIKTLKRDAVPTVFQWIKETVPRRVISRKELAPPRTKPKQRELSTSDQPTVEEMDTSCAS